MKIRPKTSFSPSYGMAGKLIDCPKCIESGEAQKFDKLFPPFPFPSIFRIGGGELQTYASWYGYVMLLAQFLEYEILECVLNIRYWRAFNNGDVTKANLKEKPTFEDAIRELELVFDRTDPESKSFISALHKARKVRNQLSHNFFKDRAEREYFFSPGGLAKQLDSIKRYERIFYPLICKITSLARAYATDYGLGYRSKGIKHLLKQMEAEDSGKESGD